MKKNLPAFAVGDIEANEWIKFEVLGFFDGSQYFVFDTIKEFFNFVSKKQYDNFNIYFHNGGKYDFLFFFEEIYNRNWNSVLIERGGRVISIEIQTGKMKFKLCDSYALLPSSLAKLIEAFNVESKKIPIDFSKHISRKNKRLQLHLKNDCLALYDVLYNFFQSDFVIHPKLTIASQAMDTFRSMTGMQFSPMKIKYENDIRDNFYSGGRVEVYKGQGSNLNYYDVNSLYPFVMLNEMPCGRLKMTGKFIKDEIGFYKVNIINTPKWYISPLLLKGEKNYFVNGKGDYYLCTDELNFLKTEFGIKFKIDYGYTFRKKEHIFNDYVQKFYKIKSGENEDSALRYIAKLMLNSLYGKFGQKREFTKIEKYNGQKKFASFDDTYFSEKYGLVLISERSRSKFILPYIASYITALARLYHFKLMNMNPEGMYYCDTDSLITAGKYPVGPEIGELSKKGIFDGIFLGNKTYALKSGKNESIVFKGFTGNCFSFEDFVNCLKNGTTLTETRNRILGFREVFVRKENILNAESPFLKTVNMKKEFIPNYDKRKLIPSKKYFYDTEAFNFSEIKIKK